MNSRTAVLRRVTIYVAALALACASVWFGSSAANAKAETTPTWAKALAPLTVPGQGCFTATAPTVQWRSVACSTKHPRVPQGFGGTEPSREDAGGHVQEVGGCSLTCDYSAETANPMTAAVGSFPS